MRRESWTYKREADALKRVYKMNQLGFPCKYQPWNGCYLVSLTYKTTKKGTKMVYNKPQ